MPTQTCWRCNGTGHMATGTRRQVSPSYYVDETAMCSVCLGSGRIEDPWAKGSGGGGGGGGGGGSRSGGGGFVLVVLAVIAVMWFGSSDSPERASQPPVTPAQPSPPPEPLSPRVEPEATPTETMGVHPAAPLEAPAPAPAPSEPQAPAAFSSLPPNGSVPLSRGTAPPPAHMPPASSRAPNLQAVYAATHKHRLRDCNGVLTFTSDRVIYRSSEAQDSFDLAIGDVMVDDGLRMLGKRWRFELEGASADRVFLAWKRGTLRLSEAVER